MRLPLLLITVATASLASAQAMAAVPDLRGRWIGRLHTLQGSCPDQGSSTLLVDHDHVSFTPADGVLVLLGRRGPDRTRLHAQLSLPGMDHKPVAMVFEAHPDGRVISGLYGTPGCRAEISLHRPQGRPLQRVLGR